MKNDYNNFKKRRRLIILKTTYSVWWNLIIYTPHILCLYLQNIISLNFIIVI